MSASEASRSSDERCPKAFSSPASGTLSPTAVETVLWTPVPLLWLAPFTSATATYLLASALGLATRHPLRWIAGSVIGVFLVFGVGDAANAVWLSNAFERLVERATAGRRGKGGDEEVGCRDHPSRAVSAAR